MPLQTNTIDEKTADSGVTVDGCLVKDGSAAATKALEVTGGAVVTVTGSPVPSVGQVLTATSPTAATFQTPAAGSATKQFFYSAETSGNSGNYRVRSQGGSGAFRYNFFVPHDFSTLTSIQAIGIVSAGAAQTARDIDLFSDYGALGEASNNHTESDTASTFDLSGGSGQLRGISLSTVFTSLAANDFCGIQIDHNSIGGSIEYIGILLRYT